MAEEVGVSHTPIREAFHQLAAEGLVTIVARGGYVVADMNINRLRELIEAQHILVRAVTHLLVARATDEGLVQLETATREVDEAEASREPNAVAEKTLTRISWRPALPRMNTCSLCQNVSVLTSSALLF